MGSQREQEGFRAAYLNLGVEEVEERAAQAREMLEECCLCGHRCGRNRLQSSRGTVCRTGAQAVVASFHPHFGEQAPLVGFHGSGTIFFSWCNLKCCYCQNYDISQLGHGTLVSKEVLAEMMLKLQERGCHNINLVSPTHVLPMFLEALVVAIRKGLHLPIVYNTGGYDSLEALSLLDGVVDIYMPDMKYSDPKLASKLSKAIHYPEVNQAAVLEMHRQVGELVLDDQGIALRGLLVRHLVLPGHLDNTKNILDFIAKKVSPNTYVNLMDQYRPCYQAYRYPPLDRSLRIEEFREAVRLAKEAGLTRLDHEVAPRKPFFFRI